VFPLLGIIETNIKQGTYYQTHLPAALEQGLIDEAVLDQALVRMYSAMVKLGYFDPSSASTYRSLAWSDVSTPDSEKLATRAAEEGMVLLKNDGILPLALPTDHNTTIAIIGSWANATDDMLGTYSGIPPYLHSPLYALQQLPNVNALYATASGFPTTGDWPDGLDAAEQADIVILASGINTDQESESNDRVSIAWTGGQLDILGQIAAKGKPTILAQFGTSLDSSPWLNNPNISAIIWGGYPGQAGGDALMNIITGKTAPAGRLPITFYPASYAQVPMTDMNLRPNAETGNPGRTNKWFSDSVFPFGYGMHYTTFTAEIQSDGVETSYDTDTLVSSCDTPYLDLCPFLSLPIAVSNTGQTTSDYVALAFISGQYGPEPYPIKQLVAYERLFSIDTGETQMAMLNLTLGSLSRYDELGNQVLYAGDYGIVIDVEQKGEQMMWNFTISGSEKTLEEWPQAPEGSMRKRYDAGF
jgi:xylan 1,4-beta-xylosidase